MDAVEYLKTLQRMCRSNMDCTTCTIYKVAGQRCGLFSAGSEKLVSTITSVENWAKEHPVRTRQSVFLERYPNAKTDEDGVLVICPRSIEQSGCDKFDDHILMCSDCRRKYWSEEV